jgi:hypothetical protein
MKIKRNAARRIVQPLIKNWKVYLTNLYLKKKEAPFPSIVDWSFLDKDDGHQPSEPADWVKKRIRMYEK